MNQLMGKKADEGWSEEQLRYRILRTVYERSGGRCEGIVTGSEIGMLLDLRYEDLFRVIHFLEHHRYIEYLGIGPRVCITEKGIRYIETVALRRRSVRDEDHPFSLGRRG